jgi:hypothetical protein
VHCLPAAEDLAAEFAHPRDCAAEAFARGLVDQRTHQRLRVERVADAHLGIGLDQPLFRFLPARFVHDQPPRGGAALSGGADRAEHHRAQREIEVGGLVDDHRVVARAFEQAAAHALRDLLRDAAPDCAGAGEGDQRYAGIGNELL